MIRRDKAEKFFRLATFQADLFSKDPSTKVGALAIAPNTLEIRSFGYNGMPRKINETIEGRWERPKKLIYVSHAEANLVANACRTGVSLGNSIAVVTLFPCTSCAKLLIQAGFIGVVTKRPDTTCPRWGEEFKYSLELLQEAGIEIMYIE